MGNKYVSGNNPFHDFFFLSLMYGANISDKQIKEDIHNSLSFILENFLDDEDDIRFLDFDIKKTNDFYRVIGKNIVSALWLSGIIPKNTDAVLREKKLIYRNNVYTFDEKKFELKIKKLKNE